jgi:hypothetical protein
VAAVAIGTLRWSNEVSLTPASAGIQPTGVLLQARDAVVSDSYVVPQETDQSRVDASIRLTNYLMHHGVFASGLTRTSVNSNVVGAATDPVITDAVLTKPAVPAEQGLE